MNKNKLKEEFYEIVKANWHYGAGEIVDTDKFFSEVLSWFSSTLDTEIKRERKRIIEDMKNYNDKLYEGDRWTLTRAFLDFYEQSLKQK